MKFEPDFCGDLDHLIMARQVREREEGCLPYLMELDMMAERGLLS